MSHPITAVYEEGILRPTQPLNLPEKAHVRIVVQPPEPAEDAENQAVSDVAFDVLYNEIIDFIAIGTTPQAVIDFHPSEEAKARVEALLFREKNEGLSPGETRELDRYLQLEHLMRLAKARARYYLAQTSSP